jgi:glycosyltransferase involved in cell wall biosynthesis
VVVTGSPPSVAVLGQLGEIGSLYFCMDDFLHMPSVSARMIAPLERRLLEQVDLVIATAAVLTASKRPASGRAVHLPQGVNYGHFAALQSVPAEIAALPRPILGFAGEASERCDFQLLRALAAAPFTGSLVLVGPHAPTCDVHREFDGTKVQLLGSRSYRDLPAYVQAFDVALIPYLLNDWTRAVDPLKLLEYLAAGVPVVSTDLPEIHKYGAAVRIAGGTAEFITATQAALADRDPDARARRQAVARENTWEARAHTFLRLLDEVVARHERRALDGALSPG